jgi:hypothetical protein
MESAFENFAALIKSNKFTNADMQLDALEKEASPNQRDNIPTMRLGLMRASRRFRRLPVSGARWKAFKTPSPPPTPSLPRSKRNPRQNGALVHECTQAGAIDKAFLANAAPQDRNGCVPWQLDGVRSLGSGGLLLSALEMASRRWIQG